MINEISLNSNNVIQMSRGQLLAWLNQLLKLNINKIQQLGNGAQYCQLLDVLYPNKVPLTKINWKAKSEYQYVNNFKVLQQCFNKLNIMKHIEVEKLVKCKYQDNLQFLQWFKKIFDNSGVNTTQYDASSRRPSEFETIQKQKKSKTSSNQVANILGSIINDPRMNIGNLQRLKSKQHSSSATSRAQQSLKTSKSNTERPQIRINSQNNNNNTTVQQIQKKNELKQYESALQQKDDKYREQIQTQYQEKLQAQREFYLKKFKEIQQLMDIWDHKRGSEQLIQNIRNIILVAPEIEWEVNSQFAQFKIKQKNLKEKENKEIPQLTTSLIIQDSQSQISVQTSQQQKIEDIQQKIIDG